MLFFYIVFMRFLILLLVSSFALTGCMSPKDSSPTQTGPEAAAPSYTEAIESASSKIKNTPEFEACMKPNVDMCINMVGNQLAQAQKSIEFCDELTRPESKEACKYGIVITQSAEQKNISLCDTLSETYKKECRMSYLSQAAAISGDITQCDALKSEMMVASGEIAPPFDRADQCKADIIMRKDDAKISDCDALASPMKDMCINMIESRANRPNISENN